MGVPEGAKMGAIGGLVGGKDGGGGRAASPAGGRRQSSRVFKGGEKANMMMAKAKMSMARIAQEDEGSISTLGSKDPTIRTKGSKASASQQSSAHRPQPPQHRRASIEGGGPAPRRASMQGGSPGGSRPQTTDSNGVVRRGTYTSPHLHDKLKGSLRMASRRLSFAFGSAMTIKVESRSTNLCRCPATRPWAQLISAHDGTTVDVMKQHVVGSLGALGRKAPVERQILSFKGVELHDDKTMRHYKIKDGAKLVLTFKPCDAGKEDLRLGYLQHRFPALRESGDAAPLLDPADPVASPRLDCSAAWSEHTAPGGKIRWRCTGTAGSLRAKSAQPPPSAKGRVSLWRANWLKPQASEASFETVVTPQLGESNVMGSLVARNKPRPPNKANRASFNRPANRASQRASNADRLVLDGGDDD